jgi:hypothetical protein
LEPGDPEQGGPVRSQDRRFALPPHLAAGRYTVCVSVGSSTGQPTIALPYQTHPEFSRRYVLGEIVVEP